MAPAGIGGDLGDHVGGVLGGIGGEAVQGAAVAAEAGVGGVDGGAGQGGRGLGVGVLRAFHRQADVELVVVEALDDAQADVAAPHEARNVLRVDHAGAVLGARGDALAEHRQQAPALPAQHVEVVVGARVGGVELAGAQRVAVAFHRVRGDARAVEVGLVVRGQRGVVVGGGLGQQRDAALPGRAAELVLVVVRALRERDAGVVAGRDVRGLVAAAEDAGRLDEAAQGDAHVADRELALLELRAARHVVLVAGHVLVWRAGVTVAGRRGQRLRRHWPSAGVVANRAEPLLRFARLAAGGGGFLPGGPDLGAARRQVVLHVVELAFQRPDLLLDRADLGRGRVGVRRTGKGAGAAQRGRRQEARLGEEASRHQVAVPCPAGTTCPAARNR